MEAALPDVARLDDIVLTASELAANVIRHARTEFTVRIIAEDEHIRLEVSDGSAILPAVEDLTESRRGLRMVQMVSERWGVDPTQDGKTVWAEFSDTPRPGS